MPKRVGNIGSFRSKFLPPVPAQRGTGKGGCEIRCDSGNCETQRQKKMAISAALPLEVARPGSRFRL